MVFFFLYITLETTSTAVFEKRKKGTAFLQVLPLHSLFASGQKLSYLRPFQEDCLPLQDFPPASREHSGGGWWKAG